MYAKVKEEQNSETSDNSYLVETTFNSEIGLDMRQEIEKKYKNSKINQSYIFPRKPANSLNYSKRNLSTQRQKTNSLQIEKSLHQQEILEIYSREQRVLIQLKNQSRKRNLIDPIIRKSRSTSKKQIRDKSSSYRSRSPIRQAIENSVNLNNPSMHIRKNKYLPEGMPSNISFLPKIPSAQAKLTTFLQKTKKLIESKFNY